MSVEECNLPPWSLYFIACDSLPCQYLSIKEFMHSTSNRELVSVGCSNRIPREDTQTTANGTTGRNEQMVVSDIINSYSYTTSAGIMNTDIIASFPGPAQLSVASSTEKRERAWNNLSHE